MEVRFHRRFYKYYEKLPAKVQTRFNERLVQFGKNPSDLSLRNHELNGKWFPYRSIDVTGDYRAIYIMDEGVALFVAIGTHSQLYGR